MNKAEFETLNTIWEIPRKPLSIDDLENKEDRTLILGYTNSGHDFHVYIENFSIKTIMYGYREKWEIEVEEDEQYVPDKRIYRETADFEFCKLLKQRGISLPFTAWGNNELEAKYHGERL